VGWVACLSHSNADAPGTTLWPPASPVKNYAGVVGATFSHYVLTYLGSGTYMALLFGSLAVVLVLLGNRLTDLVLRAIGMALLIASTSTAVWLLSPHPKAGMLLGGAGWLGTGCGIILQRHFGDFSWMIALVSFVVGMILTADELVMRLPSFGRGVWDQRRHLGQVAGALRAAAASSAAAGGRDVAPRTVTASPRMAALGKLAAQGKAPAAATSQAASPDVTAAAAATPAAKPRVSITQAAAEKNAANKNFAAAGAKPAPHDALAGGAFGISPADAAALAAKNAAAPTAKQSTAAAPTKDGASAKDATPAKEADSAKDVSPAKDAAPVKETALARIIAPFKESAAEKPAKDAVAPAAKGTFVSAPKPASPPAAKKANAAAAGPVNGEYALPAMGQLIDPERGYIESQEAQVELKREVLQQTLNDFAVEAQVVGHMTGPVITLFELSLAPGVKVSQIANLSNDIARALAAPGVRIVSPLPGKDTIGIEAPNSRKETVRLKQLMHAAPEAASKLALPLYLGKDAGGDPIVADLGTMPHMLIAGTTGSGKSVCINTIIMSLLMTRRPQDVRLILVDPKMVEMAAFESVPHLLCPIVNDMRKAESILEWAATKMDERYELLKEAGVKNVAQYNRLGAEKIYQRLGVENEQEKAQVQTRLPYYVIIIDELADLIMTSSKEVEGYIIRIAQKARAVGIHLILATQRPSVNVVTGLIKSNMPCRISFRVASRQESRIVLDQNGAEVLLGQGDMLFLQPGTSNLVRAQGTFLDDGEIHRIVEYLVGQARQEFNSELVSIKPAGLEDGEDGGGSGERDELFDKAVEIILQSQRGSVSLLQRRLSVGYSRASRIVDQMAEAGILGDFKGSQARECLMTLEDWHAFKNSVEADQSGQNALDGQPTSA
jgi:S-DNA-T family DNA segregation ATPase FtsK/SpoIIIE